MTGRCMTCSKKGINESEMKDATLETMKNGAKMVRATCANCGGKMTKFVSKDFELPQA